MAKKKISFKPGDVFVFNDESGMGLVLNRGALLINGSASYSNSGNGLHLEKVSELPKDAAPYEFVVPEPVKFAMRAVCVVDGIQEVK